MTRGNFISAEMFEMQLKTMNRPIFNMLYEMTQGNFDLTINQVS